jgi:hypothetical protein
MGEKDTARREFETVRQQPIPPEAKATIERYLSAIAASDVTQISGFIELGIGHDSNVNSATGSNQIALPALGGIVATLNPSAVRRSDNFTSLSGGVNVTHRLSPEWSIVGGAAGAAKLNSQATEFDTFNLDANLGARWSKGQEAITVGAQLQTFELDWQRFRDTKGLVAQWQHSYDERRQATLFTQYSELRYPSQSIRDADRKIIAAYAQAFSGDAAPVLFGSVYGGREDELAEGVPHLGHVPIGVRLGGQMRLGAGVSAFANASYEHRRYGGPEPIFLETRTDKQTDIGGGLSYVVRPGTTVIAQLAHTENRSNIPLNQFQRIAPRDGFPPCRVCGNLISSQAHFLRTEGLPCQTTSRFASTEMACCLPSFRRRSPGRPVRLPRGASTSPRAGRPYPDPLASNGRSQKGLSSTRATRSGPTRTAGRRSAFPTVPTSPSNRTPNSRSRTTTSKARPTAASAACSGWRRARCAR